MSPDAGDARAGKTAGDPPATVPAADGETVGRSIPWARVGVEMVAIVFSVLLALVLDDWRQSRDERQLVEAVGLSLLVELEGNQRLLEDRLPLHEALLDSLGVRVAQRISGSTAARPGQTGFGVPTLDELGFDEGLRIETSFSTSAWEAARATEAITRLPLDQLFLLAGAYTTQEDLRRSAERLRDRYEGYLLAAVEGERAAFAVVSFTSALSELIAAERLLCDRYIMLAPRLSGGAGEPDGRCGSGSVEIR